MPNTFGIVGKVELASNTSSISFSNIGGATHLFMAFNLKSDASGGATNESFKLTFNNTSGQSEYYGIRNYAFTSTAAADNVAYSVTNIQQFYGTYISMTQNAPATGFGGGQLWIGNYQNTSIGKPVISQSGSNVTSGQTAWGAITAGRWENSAAISSIQLTPLNGSNFVTGSYAVLYALKD
jgi:hypothetical protein